MITDTSNTNQRQIPFSYLLPFLIITFGIAWGILGLYIFLPEQMTGIFGEITGMHPLFFLAVYAPAISAFIVIFYRSGIKGLRRYLTRFLLWRCSWTWYAFLILGISLIFICGSALKGNLFTGIYPFPSFLSFIAALLFTAIKGPVEEFGWRGLALPLLQRKLAPAWAGLILGIIWGFWHMPAFLLSGTPQSAWSFTPFFIGSIAISIIVTPLFNSSHGSILLPAFFHFLLNNPVWPDAQPYDTYILLAVGLVIVWLNRKTMFTKNDAVTEVIPWTKTLTKKGNAPV
jgi:membrane protease YdiL (CAAX protease family)